MTEASPARQATPEAANSAARAAPPAAPPVAAPIAASPAGAAAPNPTGREILRMGVWNYVSNRWAPKSTAGRWLFDIGVLVAIFLPLAILYRLAAG